MPLDFGADDPEAVPIRDTATVMLLRDGPDGLEVFMLRRNLESDFVGGAYVFPGGGVDAGDSGPELESVVSGRSDADASRVLGVESGGLSFWVAAIRESFEEAGLLLATGADGRTLELDDPAITQRYEEYRHAIDEGEMGMATMCRRESLSLSVDTMQYFSRWITPLGASRRYDTRFFVAHAPEGQTPLHDDREVIANLWIRPSVALERHARGQFELIFPTVRSLEALDRFERADEVVAHAASLEHIDAVLPTVVEDHNGTRIVLPGDDVYDADTSKRLL